MRYKICLTIIVIFLSLTIQAQDHNPFKSIGKKSKTLTLSNGKYDEIIEKDSLERVGSVIVNRYTRKIEKFINEDSLQSVSKNTEQSRFLSIDPLTSKFAELSPYQYASNRPIDGIDLDGLEYVTYIVDIYQYKNGAVQQVIDYKWFDELQHNKHGELGQGVTYDVRVHTSSGAAFQVTPFFVSRQDMVSGALGIKADYGNYMGSTSLYEVNSAVNTRAFDNSKLISKKYNYDLPAVDFVDEQARIHDQAYDALGAKGANSLFNDWSTTPADDKALTGWNTFLRNAYTGQYKDGNDPFNKQPITDKEVNAALRGSSFFSKVMNDKLNGISKFMQTNFSSQSSKDREGNYNLFLKMYMSQDDKGNWQRNSGMWTQQKDGTYTPNAPSK